MKLSLGGDSSPLLTAIGVTVALVALVGTQVLGWEWGSDQLLPTVIGAVAGVIAVYVFVTRRGRR
ncbi:multidrug transporter [Natrinema marinum]|uniref:multidrug transporter n=1 Tax=Natrinema marinum TaxID=2961598 RepID=UPI0020C863F9|nr:multidrug transporter [Natrinema marinum]